MKVHQGELRGGGMKVAVVVSRFNEAVTGKLLEGAIDSLVRHGVSDDSIDVFWVPGAFELPATAKRLAGSGKFDGVISLGAVIRGETPHFDFVAAQTSKGIAQVAMESPVPVIYGVLTTDTVEQALDRAGVKLGNRGFTAAENLIEMVNLLRQQ